MKYTVEKRDDSFCRMTVEDILKLDFVNDVPFYYGAVELRTSGPFSKIDNPMNILANKITAFNDREEAKDISDIWIISKILEW
jgi:membrane protease subunit (stomatin/prohibitin family)